MRALYVVSLDVAIDADPDVPGDLEDAVSEAMTGNLMQSGSIVDWRYAGFLQGTAASTRMVQNPFYPSFYQEGDAF